MTQLEALFMIVGHRIGGGGQPLPLPISKSISLPVS